MTKRIILWMSVVMTGILHLRAEKPQLRLDYTTEFQTNFGINSLKKPSLEKVNWVNLLHMDFTYSMNKAISFRLSTISISETTKKNIINDMLTFSNIEEESLHLAVSVAGIGFQFPVWGDVSSELFLGVRNLNEDYFTSPCTSFFINSSCGIFPTLSVNYPLANYPCSSLGMDYKIKYKNIGWEFSIYNGVGYKNMSGRDNVFRFAPSSDGVLGVSTFNIENNGSSYYLGGALYLGGSNFDVSGTEESRQKEKKKISQVAWSYAEQKISDNITLLLHYSKAFGRNLECTDYAGGGFMFDGKSHRRNYEVGLYSGFAKFPDNYEFISEVSCKIMNLPFVESGYIQPALHYIKNDHTNGIVGMLRFGISI
ncbi:MAG: hypothetical protein SOX26_01995 [Phocaeicola sp.]|nr:hypothetical protein [Phocaeicola sp.]